MTSLMKPWIICLLAGAVLLSANSYSGTVVVRPSSQAFDAFAVRDLVFQQHQWQELLRQQQQINILQSLPLGCVAVTLPFDHFSCGLQSYRPYQYQDKPVYIQIDPPMSDGPSQ
jgi:hypothetical protein